MNKLPTILLIYSLLLSGAIFFIGIITSKSNSQFFIQLAFAPVLIYFIWELIDKRGSKNESVSKTGMIVLLVLLAMLTFSSFASIGNSKPDEHFRKYSENTPIIMKTEKTDEKIVAEIPQEIVRIVTEDDNSFVNIRLTPSSNAEVIGIGINGQEFQLLQEEGEWFKIYIDEHREGYVHGDYIVKSSE